MPMCRPNACCIRSQAEIKGSQTGARRPRTLQSHATKSTSFFFFPKLDEIRSCIILLVLITRIHHSALIRSQVSQQQR